MTAARAKVPTLAWLLTALTGLLVGMAIVECLHQAVALPVWTPVGLVETVKVAATPTRPSESSAIRASKPTPVPIPGPWEQRAPSRTILAEDAAVRLERLTLPPGTRLPPEVASGPMVLLVETGKLVVVVLSGGLAHGGTGLDPVHTRTELRTGQRLIIDADSLQAIRNDGSAPAVALVVTIIPVEAATPTLGPGEPPPRGTT